MVFICIGIFIFVQFVLRVGLQWEGISGYVFALAMIGLGVFRLRAGWPREIPP